MRSVAVLSKSLTLLAEVRQMILQAREGVARAVDSGLAALYWHIGRRIQQDILKEKRAAYGEKIVSALGRQLTWTHFKWGSFCVQVKESNMSNCWNSPKVVSMWQVTGRRCCREESLNENCMTLFVWPVHDCEKNLSLQNHILLSSHELMIKRSPYSGIEMRLW